MATSAGFWGEGSDPYTFLSGRSPNRYQLMRILRKRGMRNMGEILSTLLEDSSPATSASVTVTQVDATRDVSDNVQGGVRGTTANEQVDLLYNKQPTTGSANTTRAVSAADVTALQTEIIPSGARALRSPPTYPTDSSGNGGGGKQDNE